MNRESGTDLIVECNGPPISDRKTEENGVGFGILIVFVLFCLGLGCYFGNRRYKERQRNNENNGK